VAIPFGVSRLGKAFRMAIIGKDESEIRGEAITAVY
jgi:hypothetical protein